MRKPSPISISSPRETITSRPSASAREREQHRGRVVVHDERRLGAGQPAQDRGDVILPRAARAVAQVELEVRVAARGLDDLRERLLARAARGRDSCARSRRSRSARGEGSARAPRASSSRRRCGEVARVGAGADLLARAVEHRPRGVDRERIVDAARELVHRRQIAQLHPRKATRHSRPDASVMPIEARWSSAIASRSGSSRSRSRRPPASSPSRDREYRGPGSAAHDVKPLSYVSPASHGWTWPLGTPGFRIGHDESRWNMSAIHWRDLSALRIAARPAGVDPQSLRVLEAARLLPGPRERPFLLVGGRDAHGRTCIGAQPGNEAPTFFCPHSSATASRSSSSHLGPPFVSGAWSIYVNGVVSAAVTRGDDHDGRRDEHGRPRHEAHGHAGRAVPVLRPHHLRAHVGDDHVVPRQPVPWNARIDFYGAHGKLATLHAPLTKPGAYVVPRAPLLVTVEHDLQRLLAATSRHA